MHSDETVGHGEKITLGQMRASGVRDVPVYCTDYHCSHWIKISGDEWPDHARVSDLEPALHLHSLRQGRGG